MPIGDIQLGDIGTVLIITIEDGGAVIDVSSASATKNIILMPPDGSAKTIAAEFSDDGTDGKIKVQTTASTIDEVGEWGIQGHVVLTAGTFYTQVAKFDVLPSLV